MQKEGGKGQHFDYFELELSLQYGDYYCEYLGWGPINYFVILLYYCDPLKELLYFRFLPGQHQHFADHFSRSKIKTLPRDAPRY